MSLDLEKNPKVIFLDWGVLVHRSIFSFYSSNNSCPSTYLALSSTISILKNVGVNREDLIIIAVDSSKGSWRREIDSNYKANRKELRERTKINWKEQFEWFDRLKNNLVVSTPFYVAEGEKLEADDIIAEGCKFFNDREVIIVSTDSDFEQLTALSHVKVFSPVSRNYKFVKNPYRTVAKKIQRESTDNLVTPVLNELEYNKRLTLVSLLDLPVFVRNQVQDILVPIKDQYENGGKKFDLNFLWFDNIRDRFDSIYSTNKVVSMQDSLHKKFKKEKNNKKKHLHQTTLKN